jgi:hypothetical protein
MANTKPIKPPVIRRGQKRPYVKGSQVQIDQRRGFVTRMMNSGATKTEIHRAVRQRFNIEWRQTDRYIAFVSGTNTRLPRVRVEHHQNPHEEHMKFLIKMYEDAAKQ